MTWNWQQPNWPEFTYYSEAIKPLEATFLSESGTLKGALKYLNSADKEQLIIDHLAQEALKTSEIEGEYLNRESVQSSIRKHFGLSAEPKKTSNPKEQGIADLLMNLYMHFDDVVSNENLWEWHKMVCMGSNGLENIGSYRTHIEPMQIVSGMGFKQKVYFEAPPSKNIFQQMEKFIEWFNATTYSLSALTRAGIAHLYFVSIHPFEDGNGRIARAIAEKALSQHLGSPTLIALSHIISLNRAAYYEALEKNNQTLEITDWLIYFSNTILQAQKYSIRLIDFLIQKTKLLDIVKDKLKPRQLKVLLRMFREGPDGFKGGLSADNYINISGASRATATRDLQELVEKKALISSGQLKGTRYHLQLSGLSI
jgi:Fic family protein